MNYSIHFYTENICTIKISKLNSTPFGNEFLIFT
ncbi:hypothetical protein T4B_1913 [Trichinella pseudospiralis]|uniref:Uncharacterized protein n=1 Tax=Trichinella pseudospiralis TaxID=6337 RepID=A0A0V1G9U9_TRIPS|nr:hypothetical protein T4B_1913 [Trichinella pseudospiralis]